MAQSIKLASLETNAITAWNGVLIDSRCKDGERYNDNYRLKDGMCELMRAVRAPSWSRVRVIFSVNTIAKRHRIFCKSILYPVV